MTHHPESQLDVGTVLSPSTFVVDAERMKIFTLLTKDPNPIHWDRNAPGVRAAGGKLINQGGLNVGYIHNAVRRWAGDRWVVSNTRVRFLANAFEGDRVTASGVVSVAASTSDEPLTIEVRLRRDEDGTELVSGRVELMPKQEKVQKP